MFGCPMCYDLRSIFKKLTARLVIFCLDVYASLTGQTVTQKSKRFMVLVEKCNLQRAVTQAHFVKNRGVSVSV